MTCKIYRTSFLLQKYCNCTCCILSDASASQEFFFFSIRHYILYSQHRVTLCQSAANHYHSITVSISIEYPTLHFSGQHKMYSLFVNLILSQRSGPLCIQYDNLQRHYSIPYHKPLFHSIFVQKCNVRPNL